MKLSRYMRLHNVTDSELAVAIGKCRTAVLRYRHGSITPPVNVIAQIEKVTAGKVTFEDFVREDA
jgi:transcriptional regulator with XRE-family HTH domain